MRHLYLDIFSGLSGDMFIGALLDLGVDFKALERELQRLQLGGYHLHHSRKQKSGIEGVKFDVHVEGEDGDANQESTHSHPHPHPHPHEAHHSPSRDHATIRQLIEASALSDWVRQRALSVFARIAMAEGKIHGVPPERVHFHEVGGVDSIIDIVGACIALEMLGCPEVTAGPVTEGTGLVKCAHGFLPIPTAATLEILGARGIPITQCAEPHELVTPTGAALLAEFARSFAPMQSVVGARVGYGLGTRNNHTRPNVVRAVLWETTAQTSDMDWETDTIAVLETNLDDTSGELLGHVLEKALRLGALDAFHTPIQMKKHRPGILFTVLCTPDRVNDFAALMLTETSAFGVRCTPANRFKLQRSWVDVATEFGKVKVKVGTLNGKIVQTDPEFESARSIAAMAGVPLKTVMSEALNAYRSQNAPL